VPTIVERKTRSGETSYLAQIVRRKYQHTESRVFKSRSLATAWANKREQEIDLAIAEGRPLTISTSTITSTLGDAIRKYIATTRKMGRTKEQCLRTILNEYKIVQMKCDQITSKALTDFAEQLSLRPASPSTVLNYMSHLSSIFQIAGPAWGYPLDAAQMRSAMTVCKRLGVTSKAQKRDRRPTLE
jgi:hypothetical protein